MSKADVIREYVKKYPQMKTNELTDLINKEKGLAASKQEVSKYRGDLKKAGVLLVKPKPTPVEQPAQAAPPKPDPASGVSSQLAKLKELVDSLGGKEEVIRILDVLG